MKNLRIFALGLLAALYGSSHAITVRALSLSFEENRGQAPEEAHFLARGQGYSIALTSEGNHILLRHGGRGVSIGTRLVDSDPDALVRGEQKQEGRVNYIRRDASLTNIPTYARVRYQRVYPGIDLVYYGNQQQLEYDFVISPGADPHRIALQFDGVDDMTIDDQGNLRLRAAESEVVQQRPVLYQRLRNSRKEIEGGYRIVSPNTVTFDIGAYDPTAPLVIDPILSYSTFLGGSNGDDDARSVTTDSAGNLLVTGTTTSTNFPTAFPLQPVPGFGDPTFMLSDAFVTKLNPAGTAMIFSTYFGGSGDDDAVSISVDSLGYTAIAGTTNSTDFPTSLNALSRVCVTGEAGCRDAFVSVFDATGSILAYSTYLGGTGDDEGRGVDFDSFGNFYITGRTDSTDFPITAGVYSTDPAAGGFVTKFTIAGTIGYSTYFRTFFGPADPRGIAVDAGGNAYVTGGIGVSGSGTGVDVFITKLNPSGSAIIYTQTIRGFKDDISRAIAVDANGNAYVAGETASANLPTVSAFQSAFGGGPAFRSVNGGSTWVPSSGINRSSLYALAVAPGTPSTMYAGADDETGGGLFKSTNGGDTWTSSANGISDVRIHALAVDPVTPATVYAGTRSVGVYKSTNGGSTWSITPLNNVFVTALAIDPATPTTIYAGTDGNGIYKSFNSGLTWFPINIGLPATPVRSIVIEPGSNNTIYAATSAGVYKSTTGGSAWSSSNTGFLDSNINVLVADPRTPNLLLAGTNSVGVFRSTNGGIVWSAANSGLTSSGSVTSVTALAIDPVTGTWYAAAGESNAMEVYRSTDGTNWTRTGFASTRVSALVVDRNSGGAVLAATVGGSDAFIAKWNASGSLVYATYFGGYRDDAANAIAVDSSGAVYVAGTTSSTNFPLLNPVQSSFGGGSGTVSDAFALKLEASGGLGFSTYVGGSSNDLGQGIAVDSSNSAYLVGVTASQDFPTSSALNSTRAGLMDAFIVKLGEGSALAYSTPIRGGFSATSQGSGASTSVGYGRIQPTSGGSLPSGLAIFGFRQNNTLVSETAVPTSTLINSGRIYAEVGTGVNTGIAIANPNGIPVTVTFYFTDRNGQRFGENITVIGANGQLARFLDQSPFSGTAPLSGTFSFTASQPVAVIALRGFTNERGEFLLTTLPVADLSLLPDNEPVLFPHFADGGGWSTQILLVNTSDTAMSGTVQFAGNSPQNYTIPPRSGAKVVSPGTSTDVLTGSVRVTPASGSNTPTGVGVFSFKNAGGVTVAETGVSALRAGNAFRLYAESSGTQDQVGSIQTGIAIANPSSATTTVTFELTTITGVSTGLVSSIQLPGNGQVAMFLGQIPGFAGLPNPFQGVLRIATTASSGITLVGLRGRYNERRDFLITTTQPVNESTIINAPELFFPHFADGGGYTTQFILFNGSGNQSSSGLIRFVGQSGQSLSVGVR